MQINIRQSENYFNLCVRVTALAYTQRRRRGAVLVMKEMKWGVKSTGGDSFLVMVHALSQQAPHTHTCARISNLSALPQIHSTTMMGKQYMHLFECVLLCAYVHVDKSVFVYSFAEDQLYRIAKTKENPHSHPTHNTSLCTRSRYSHCKCCKLERKKWEKILKFKKSITTRKAFNSEVHIYSGGELIKAISNMNLSFSDPMDPQIYTTHFAAAVWSFIY